jgi:hypothetical protein
MVLPEITPIIFDHTAYAMQVTATGAGLATALNQAGHQTTTRRLARKRIGKDGGWRAVVKRDRLRREAILIFRIGSIGDTVIALPCFHRIARTFPNARRIVVTNRPVSVKAAPVESVLGHSGLIDDFIYFSSATRNLRELLELRERIRETGAHTLIYRPQRSNSSSEPNKTRAKSAYSGAIRRSKSIQC